MLNVKYRGFLLAYFPSDSSVPTLKNLKTKQNGNNENLVELKKNVFYFGKARLDSDSSPSSAYISARKKNETAADRKGGPLYNREPGEFLFHFY